MGKTIEYVHRGRPRASYRASVEALLPGRALRLPPNGMEPVRRARTIRANVARWQGRFSVRTLVDGQIEIRRVAKKIAKKACKRKTVVR